MCADAEMTSGIHDRRIDVTEEIDRITCSVVACEPQPYGVELTAPIVRSVIRARSRRAKYFDPDLFGEPAWDIMLDLLAARLEGKEVSVSSVCMASGVSQSTAMRWITRLTVGGWLVRKADPTDGRRSIIELSDEAVKRLTCCLSSELGPGYFIT